MVPVFAADLSRHGGGHHLVARLVVIATVRVGSSTLTKSFPCEGQKKRLPERGSRWFLKSERIKCEIVFSTVQNRALITILPARLHRYTHARIHQFLLLQVQRMILADFS